MSIQKHLVSTLLLLVVSSASFAGEGDRTSAEERWNNLSPERQQEITTKAAEKGFDMSTEEGRQEFFDARREHRHAFRKEIRELSPEERQALREEMRGLTREERREFLRKRFGN